MSSVHGSRTLSAERCGLDPLDGPASCGARQVTATASCGVRQGTATASCCVRQGTATASCCVRQGTATASCCVRQGTATASCCVRQGTATASCCARHVTAKADRPTGQPVTVCVRHCLQLTRALYRVAKCAALSIDAIFTNREKGCYTRAHSGGSS